jgi:hypothetical protein
MTPASTAALQLAPKLGIVERAGHNAQQRVHTSASMISSSAAHCYNHE